MPETTDLPLVTQSSKLKIVLKILTLIIVSIAVYLGSAVATGFISVFSNNIETSTFNLIFDSQITIAYLLTYYSLTSFYKMSAHQNYFMFVVTLLLSFTTNFIQGALTLLILPPLLKKLKLIQITA
ncbi:hypothetical protein COT87_01465 [Candidatus Collierbacteria bacterium CG10_big_fil_rev_8_21_14_0_10_44_9]|uniref:Uncharacterized protein n=1 Tax=Candidatus Collierbacteria bacterium CG10_big_fil_rev_8_21_14_0_10_44_9 TaxID=1974535 RepID=A0A2H0VL38_9BACT|nr:MAG: hypothetical protein COT87_01465 [Candidatus Collierbacteria bacterium CG10_big_fil_rev_8_21_14_0_10_44_9]